MYVALSGGLLGIYAGTIAYHHQTNDVLTASLSGWRIGTTGTPWLEHVGTPGQWTPNSFLWTGVAENGHVVGFRSPGAVAADVPPYLISGIFSGSGLDDFSATPSSLWAAVLSVIAVVLLGAALGHRLTRRQKVVALAVLALGTPVWSVSANTLWPHTVTVLGIAGMAWAAHRERWWLLGSFGGIALWGRLHAVLIVAVLGLGLAVWRRQPAIAVKAGATSALFLGLASAWSHWVYGTWNPSGGYAAATSSYLPGNIKQGLWSQVQNYLGLLVAPDRGILVWTPLLLLLGASVVRSWRGLPDWTRLLVAAGVAYTLVQGHLNGFTGGGGIYGYRLTLELLLCVFPAYALSAGAAGPWARRLFGPVLALQLAAISLGAVTNSFMVRDVRAWKDNSVLLGLRHYPVAVSLWLVVITVFTALLTQVVRDRDIVPAWPDLTTRRTRKAPASADRERDDERAELGSGRLDLRTGDRLHQAQRGHQAAVGQDVERAALVVVDHELGRRPEEDRDHAVVARQAAHQAGAAVDSRRHEAERGTAHRHRRV